MKYIMGVLLGIAISAFSIKGFVNYSCDNEGYIDWNTDTILICQERWIK